MRAQWMKWIGPLVAALLLASPVRAQAPTPDAEAAARELLTTMQLTTQFKAMLPMIFKAMKPGDRAEPAGRRSRFRRPDPGAPGQDERAA